MAEGWKVNNPFESLWDDEKYQQLLQAITEGVIEPDAALETAKNLKENQDKAPPPTFLEKLDYDEGTDTDLDLALNLLSTMSGEVSDYFQGKDQGLGQKGKKYRDLLPGFDDEEDLEQVLQDKPMEHLEGPLPHKIYQYVTGLSGDEKALIRADKYLENLFNQDKKLELTEVANEYGGLLKDNITEDIDGNNIVRPPNQRIVDNRGRGVNYSREDLIEYYKGALPHVKDKIKDMSKEEGDQYVYDYVKEYKPELIEPLEWEPQIGRGYIWNEVKNAWHQAGDRWRFTQPAMFKATLADLAGDNGQGLNDVDKRVKFKKVLRETYPEKDELWYNNKVEEVRTGDTEALYKDVADILKKSKVRWQKILDNDPNLAAQLEWNMKNVGEEFNFKENGFTHMDKFLSSMFLSAVPTVLESVLIAGKGTSLALSGLTWFTIASKTRDKAMASRITSKLSPWYQGLGQFIYGYNLMGGQHLIDAVHEQTNYREIDKHEYGALIEAKKKIFESETKDPRESELFLENYIKNNLLEQNGNYYIKPVSAERAIQNAIFAAETQGVIGGAIEQLDVIMRTAKIMPGPRKGFANRTMFEKIVAKVDDVTRTVSSKGPKFIVKPLAYIGNKGARFISHGIGEGLEEIGQELSDIGIKVHGPQFPDRVVWKWLQGDASRFGQPWTSTTWDEQFDYRRTIRDPFLGGLMGGGAAGSARISAQEWGIYDYLQNRRTKKFFETNPQKGYFSKNYGTRLNPKWRIVQSNPVLNRKTGEYDKIETVDVRPEDVKDISTGEEHQVEFDNIKDASNKAREFNIAFHEEQGKIYTWLNRGILDKEILITKKKRPKKGGKRGEKEDVWIVSSKDSKGSIVENYGVYSSHNKARKDANKIREVQKKTQKGLEDAGYDSVEELNNDPSIIEFKKTAQRHFDNHEDIKDSVKDTYDLDNNDIVNVDESTDGTTVNLEIDSNRKQEYSRDEYKLVLKSFMYGSEYAQKAGLEVNKNELEGIREFESLTEENPSILRDAIKFDDGSLLNELAENDAISKEELVKDIEGAYGESHPEIVKEIRDDLLLGPEVEVAPEVEEKVEKKVEVKPEVPTKEVEGAPEVEAGPTVEKDTEVRDDVRVRPEQKVTPETIKDYTDKELDAKIEQAKRESKSKTKSKKKRAKLALKVAEKEKARREATKKKAPEVEKVDIYGEYLGSKESRKSRRKEDAEIDSQEYEIGLALPGEKIGKDYKLKTLSNKEIDRQIKLAEHDFVNTLRIYGGNSNQVIQSRQTVAALRAEKARREKEGLTYVGEPGKAKPFGKKKAEKKAPEVGEDMVTIPGHMDTMGEPETMTRAEAEKRLDQLLNPTYLPGEEGAEDAMMVGDEIRALREGLGKKKPKLTIQKEGSKDEKRTKNVLEYLFDKFAGEIEYETINDPTLYKNGKPVEAYYDTEKKKVIINTAFATTSSPFHEFAHPFITVLRTENKTLFNNLVKEILATPEGRALMKQILKVYGKDKKSTDIDVSEELLAFAIEKSADKQYKPQSTFKRVVNKILNFFRNMFFGKSNTVYAQALESDTTIEDIGRLFANSDVTIRFKDRDKSLTDTNYDFSKNPRNMHQFKLKIEKEGKEVVESIKETDKDFEDILEEISPKSRALKEVHTFFNGSWDVMFQMAKDNDMAISVSDFTGLIALHFPDLQTAVEQWAYSKFKGRKKIGGSNKSLIPVDEGPNSLLSKFEDIMDGVDEGLDLNNALKTDTVWEKELTVNDIMFLRELGVNITVEQLHALYAAVRNSDFKNFKDWKIHALKKILKRSAIVTSDQDKSLLRLYNRLGSSIPTNKDIGSHQQAYIDNGIISVNYRTNYMFKKAWVPSDAPGEQGKWVYMLETKGPISDDGRSNPQYDKIYLWEYDNPTEFNLFHWISGTDVRKPRPVIDKKTGRPILVNGQPKFTSEKEYGFLRYTGKSMKIKENNPYIHFKALEEELRKIGRTIAFSRGDSQSIATVEITTEHKIKAKNESDTLAYWNQELRDGYLKNRDQIKELMQGSEMDRAANIAVHEALKKVYPKYAGDNAANVFKRLKIPFSKVTISKSMPNYFIEKFNPKDVMFKYTDPKTGEEHLFDPRQDMGPLGLVYIGDGNSLTSQSFFDLLEEHFGISSGQAKAKTVIYQKDGDNVIAVKHEHVLPKLGFSIVSKSNTDEVLYSVDSNRNIKNEKTGESVHVLNTSDEIKIGDMFTTSGGRFEASGQSLGLNKFDEKIKNVVPHIMQWYNHVNDPKIIKAFMDEYIPKLNRNLRKRVFDLAIDSKDKTAVEKIGAILDRLEGQNEEAFIPAIVELARLGGALHPSLAILVDKIVQTQIINPILKLSDMDGSIFDISMDMTGQLGRNEISLSNDNARKSGIVVKQYAKDKGMAIGDVKKLAREEPEVINAWLNEKNDKGEYINEVFVWVTRSPVPHVGGAYMARVASLHGRRSITDLNPLDVKEKIEGDGDGDKVHIELMTPKMTEIYKTFIEGKEPSALNLSHFVRKSYGSIMSTLSRIKLIGQLTFGKNSIAEIANIGLAYGSINKIFRAFKLPNNKVVMVRQPTENINTNLYYKLTDNKRWSGTVEELLRLYLQGAVDNGKYNLLSDWDYDKDKLSLKLFRYKDSDKDISLEDYKKYIKPIMRLHKEAQRIRRGKPAMGIKDNTKSLISKSQNYLEYTENRIQFLLDGRHIKEKTVEWADEEFPVTEIALVEGGISPIEQIAIAPAVNYNNWMIAHKLFGLDGTPFRISEAVYENSHFYAMKEMEKLLPEVLRFYTKKDGINPKEEHSKGIKYYNNMIEAYKNILVNYVEQGVDSLERNPKFIQWQEKYGELFKGLSNYAQIVATYEFLREYNNFRNDISVKRSESVMPSFPPVSAEEIKTRVSLLRGGTIRKYFSEFNYQVSNNRNEAKLSKNEVYRDMFAISNAIYETECK